MNHRLCGLLSADHLEWQFLREVFVCLFGFLRQDFTRSSGWSETPSSSCLTTSQATIIGTEITPSSILCIQYLQFCTKFFYKRIIWHACSLVFYTCNAEAFNMSGTTYKPYQVHGWGKQSIYKARSLSFASPTLSFPAIIHENLMSKILCFILV